MMSIQCSNSLGTFCKLKCIEKNKFNILFSDDYISYLRQYSNDSFFLLYSDVWVIPVIIKKKYIFTYAEFISEPAQYNICKGENDDLKKYLNNVCAYLKSNKVQWINQPNASTLFSEYPDKSIWIPFGSYIVDLTKNTDDLFAQIHSKHRNVIKKAQKDGVNIVIGGKSLLNDYYELDKDTWSRSGKQAYSYEMYSSLLKHCTDNAIVAMSYYNGLSQSGAIIIYNSNMGYYLYGASKNKPHTGANNYLHWELIKYLKKKGVLKYSFVGARIKVDDNSKYAGIQKFKERFGGHLFSGYLFKVVFSKFHYNLYRAAISLLISIKAKRCIRFKDIIDQEIYKWRN